MVSSSVVFYKIATTCLLIVVGYIARRMKLLPEISVSVISKFILNLAMPCYLVYYMPSSISPSTIGRYWYFPLLGILLALINDLFGYATARLWAKPGERATFRIIVGLPNWVFMALAVCEPLFREDGVRVVLLYNVGVTFYLWTAGMTSFRSAVGWKEILRQLFINPQTIALIAGFILAMVFPFLQGMEKLGSDELAALPVYIGMMTPVWETIYLVGGTALPLSILQIGLMLGEPRPAGAGSVDKGTLLLTGGLRLLAAPAITLAVLYFLCLAGLPLTGTEFVVSCIILAMPAAVVCLTIVELYGGATRLAASAILWMTIASLFTVPLVTWAAQKVYALL